MSNSYPGTSGPSGNAGLRPAHGQQASGRHSTPDPVLTRLRQPSQERFASNQLKKLTDSIEASLAEHKWESSVTRERVNTLLEYIANGPGFGKSDLDTTHGQKSTPKDDLVPALERIEGKLRDLSDRNEGAGHTGSDETARVTSELRSDIRNIIINYQASSKVRTGSGESPPPPPRALFGRDELIEEVVCLVDSLTPVALIGVGGIGKTSIALSALHHDRIKQRFGSDRRFIRCDQFPVSLAHFLSRLSKVTGAGIENPKDLIPLRPFLSSKDMFIVLDNAESILDPQGMEAQEIYAAIEELIQFNNICLCITSRISTIPPDCEPLEVQILSMEAACNTFYRIYKHSRGPALVKILKRLDFHPLSITLLATVARHNKWNVNRLTREWERQRTGILHTHHNKSLAATIELSLASPMFQELGPNARELLGVVAFFPQGVNENNLNWLFPTISDATNIVDKFCILSLTSRSNGFITMLAPLRDHLCPKDPRSSPLLYTTKERYFSRLSVDLDPDKPNFGEARWIVSEDVNVEHLLDVFTSIDADSDNVWNTCTHFVTHLFWHKQRLVVLGPKIEGLPDGHPSKPECLFELSRLLGPGVGNYTESKRLLIYTLRLWRERGDDFKVAQTLGILSDANRMLDLRDEGMQQAREALGIFKQLNDVSGQGRSLHRLAQLLYDDDEFDAAEEATLRSIDFLPDDNDRFLACQRRRRLGYIYHSRGETEEAIEHLETALAIASHSNWHEQLAWTHYSFATLFSDQGRFNDARAHIERAKSYAVNHTYVLGRAMQLQAELLYRESRFEEARSEALCATDFLKKVGATKDLKITLKLLKTIEAKMGTSGSGVDDEESSSWKRCYSAFRASP